MLSDNQTNHTRNSKIINKPFCIDDSEETVEKESEQKTDDDEEDRTE